ncbi:MAG: AAA family ATPase, partial [Acidimicrobiales bacterium]
LDVETDVASLEAAIAQHSPKLLILDPFVRLHRIDENSSAEVAGLLDRLRQIQRRHGVAILIVHHAKKNGGSARGGQALRGSSEFHAWVDSLLYLKRAGKGELRLSVEHRAAPSMPDAVPLALVEEAPKLSLEIMEGGEDEEPSPPARSPEERILAVLAAGTPMTTKALRDACGMKTARVCEALDALVAVGRVSRTAAGYAATPA